MGALDLSLGGIFIGCILNVMLFGFSCVQIYLYRIKFGHDNWKIKAMAYSIFTFDFLNSLFDVIFVYRLLVTHFGNFVAANTSDIFFALDPVMTGLIAFQCQCFFAWRVHRLTHTWWVPAIILVAGGASFLSALGTTIGVTIVTYYDALQKIRSVVIIWLAGAALADSVITCALIYTLNKSRTGFAATDDVLTKLIRATLQTGLLTTTFAIIDLILYLSSTSTLHLIFNLPLAKLYCNTLLSSLNARAMVPMSEAYSSEMQSTNHRRSAFNPALSGRSQGIGNRTATDLEAESINDRKGVREVASKCSIPFRQGDSSRSLGYGNDVEKSGGSDDGELSPVSFQHQREMLATMQPQGGGPGKEEVGQTQTQDSGVHVLTVEEQFEERHQEDEVDRIAVRYSSQR
ncbi:unnamed protein product [Tilletia controversa]|uniref:DUF6534 domain-containing protein n=3 Tax=Tilletia TaxID=13289 RepID=A0A8X7MZS5_9BASI|nr:hypothetical protein CF336_g1988 [Tilletia laevis]KAE8204723.1 hypothetical protein CF328_g922 [Tilletia controversa]KAE8262743.1 hypothetical protein A4X03_0g2209 [Tilletia caries]KAE8207177.1 hypothetical protein CF335_g1333 [Tilletia laevis]KAE8253634.1 hypothetical protein A4X06_0g1311 [Tilletia controversa]